LKLLKYSSGFPSHIKLKNSLIRSLNSACSKFGSEVSKWISFKILCGWKNFFITKGKDPWNF
jgi:hypothetical protein